MALERGIITCVGMQIAGNHSGSLLCSLLHYAGYIKKAIHALLHQDIGESNAPAICHTRYDRGLLAQPEHISKNITLRRRFMYGCELSTSLSAILYSNPITVNIYESNMIRLCGL
jgi:hypothetical protein